VDDGAGAFAAGTEAVAGYVEGTWVMLFRFMGTPVSQTLLSALRASHFLLLRQKKVSKEKATPGCAVGFADSPALLETPGGWLNSPAAQTTPADYPRRFSVARRSTRGPKGGVDQAGNRKLKCCGQPEKKPKTTYQSSNTDALPGLLRGAEQRRWAGGSRLALSEPQASLGKPPGSPSSARNPRSGHRPKGRLFFAYFLLAKQKKVRRPQGGTPSQFNR